MLNEEASDQLMVESCRSGDQRAFRALVGRYQRRAYVVAFGIVRNRDDALDICQLAFEHAFAALDSFDGRARFFTWLYRIVHNLAIDHLRRRRGTMLSLDDDARPLVLIDERHEGDPPRQLANRRLHARLTAALASLTPAHRAVVTLREVHGLSYQEISEVTGCAIGTVMSRLFHARKRLQRVLCEDGADLGLAA